MGAMITVGDIELVDSVRLDLLDCKSKKAIEAVFSKAGITDYKIKTAFLYIAMQIQEVYGTARDTIPSDKEVYEYYVKFFLKGVWREFV